MARLYILEDMMQMYLEMLVGLTDWVYTIHLFQSLVHYRVQMETAVLDGIVLDVKQVLLHKLLKLKLHDYVNGYKLSAYMQCWLHVTIYVIELIISCAL